MPVYIHKHAVRHHLNNEDPSFLMVGGLVFSVLSHPFLEATEAYTPQSPADVRLLLLMQASLQHPGELWGLSEGAWGMRSHLDSFRRH